MKPFIIKSPHGDIGVQPTENENIFILTCMFDGYSAIAKKVNNGSWVITNGDNQSTAEMLDNAELIGKLIERSMQHA